MKKLITLATLSCLIALTGCSGNISDLAPRFKLDGVAAQQPSTRDLGKVSPAKAFRAARQVLAQEYVIDESRTSVATGTIVTYPKYVIKNKGRLLGDWFGRPNRRRVVRLQLVQSGENTTAQLTIIAQHKNTGVYRDMSYAAEQRGDNYSGNPGEETNADINRAAAGEQAEAWDNFERDSYYEDELLDKIARKTANM